MSRQFESALAAMQHGDHNPMRQYLRLFPLHMDCEDCGETTVCVSHGKSVICKPCHAIREAFLAEITA